LAYFGLVGCIQVGWQKSVGMYVSASEKGQAGRAMPPRRAPPGLGWGVRELSSSQYRVYVGCLLQVILFYGEHYTVGVAPRKEFCLQVLLPPFLK